MAMGGTLPAPRTSGVVAAEDTTAGSYNFQISLAIDTKNNTGTFVISSALTMSVESWMRSWMV